MDDLISRRLAIEALYDWEMTYDWDEHCREEPKPPCIVSPSDVIIALPSSQPEPEQNTMPEQLKMNGFGVKTGKTCTDAISRQDAIDALDTIESEVADGEGFRYAKWREYFRDLPSAQPEIIRCKDCAERGRGAGMKDLISIQAVIDVVKSHYRSYDNDLLEVIVYQLENLSSAQPEQQWIPCSERLPEDDTLMLVNYIDNRLDTMDMWIGWHEMENVWYIDGEAHSREYGNEVVAWMPLPEPYKERREEC